VGTRGCLKGALLSALIIASLILSSGHVARAQFEVSPSEFTTHPIPPSGSNVKIPQELSIWNKDNINRFFSIYAVKPPENEVGEGFEPIPDISWLFILDSFIEVEENSSKSVEMWVNIHRWENLLDKRWEAWIRIERMVEPGEIISQSVDVAARLLTATELAPLPRSVEVSISLGSWNGLPGTSLTYFTVTVQNTGSIDDTYTLGAVGETGWPVSIEPTSLILAAGATGEATLSVVVPPDASEGTSTTVIVSATSQGDPTVIVTIGLQIFVSFIGPPPPLYLTISEENFTLQVGESRYLTATLISDSPVADKLITWSATAGTIAPSSGKTDTAGQVTVVYTAPSYETYVIVSASYAGSEQYESCSGTSFGTITAPPTGVSMELVIAIAIVIGCAIIGAAILLAKRR